MRQCLSAARAASVLAISVLGGCTTMSIGSLTGSPPPPPPPPVEAGPPPKPAVVVPSSFSQLSEDDRQIAFDAALGAVADGKRRPWKGAKVYGFVEPGAEEKRDEATCRKYNETVYINGRPKSAAGLGCRSPDGQWRIVS